jgi:hypothetical protein
LLLYRCANAIAIIDFNGILPRGPPFCAGVSGLFRRELRRAGGFFCDFSVISAILQSGSFPVDKCPYLLYIKYNRYMRWPNAD